MTMRAGVASVAVIGVLWALPVHGEAPAFSPKITEVTVFKDGHALVMSTAKTTFEKGWCRTRTVPVPVLGTFWTFVKEPGARVDFVKSGYVDSTEKRPCLTFEEMIEANKGKEAIIYEAAAGPSAGAVQHEGVLMGILKHETTETHRTSTREPRRRDRYGNWVSSRTVQVEGERGKTSVASFVMIRKTKGVHLIQRQNIRGITLLDKAPATTHVEKKQVREIAIHVDRKGRPAAAPAEVGVVYLQRGIRWIPDYQVELLPGGKAKVTLQGTIVNELADLADVNVRLVVGVPNFMMKGQLSPMALREVGLHLGTYFAPPPGPGAVDMGYQYLSNAMMSQRAAPVRQPGAVAGGVNVPAEGQREDLFLYHRSGVTLKKGERAVLTLLEVTVPYEDVYTWDIPPCPPREMWRHIGGSQRQMLTALTGAKAMHKIRLTNTGKDPWTTGPATFFKAGVPLGQQLMTFTSVKNQVDIPVTVATDLNTKREETEVERKHNAMVVDGHQLTQVRLTGKLTVTNFKDKDVTVTVTRRLIGTVTSVGGGKLRMTNIAEDASRGDYNYPWFTWSWPYWWYRTNGLAEITYDVKVPKGKSTTVEYAYHYYYR